MGRALVAGVFLSIGIFATVQAPLAADRVDVGNPASEAGHNPVGWGPIEPEHSGGAYGGIDHCRAVYAPPEGPGENWASLDLDFGPPGYPVEKCLTLSHLDGISGADDFEVFVNDSYVGAFIDPGPGSEVWIITCINVSSFSGICNVRLVSTKPPWLQFDPYGQVCFEEIVVEECSPTGLDETSWGSVKALYR